MNTTLAGIIQLIFAGLSAFQQVWGTIHGVPVDPLHATMTGGLAMSGIAAIKSADAPKN